LLTLLGLATLGAHAGTLIASPPAGSTTTVFANGSTCAGGTDAGFTVSGSACWPNDQVFGFGANGFWNNGSNGFGLIAPTFANSSYTISLGGLYSSVGGFVNYDPSAGGSSSSSSTSETSASLDPIITAIAADGVSVLGTYDLSILDPISTPGGNDAGAFVGIQDATNDIAYLELSNDYLAIHSITLGTTASQSVPEPSTFLLLGVGLALLQARHKNRTR
jgi:hypothetical protein